MADHQSDPGATQRDVRTRRGEAMQSFEPNKGGMQVHYLSRRVNTSGAAVPLSDSKLATVAAERLG